MVKRAKCSSERERTLEHDINHNISLASISYSPEIYICHTTESRFKADY